MDCQMMGDDTYYSDTKDRELFGYKVEDDSMEPVFKKGDIVVVNPNLALKPLDFVVAKVGEKVVLRKLNALASHLEALSEKYSSIRVSEAEILGKVVESKRLYRKR